ncbi:hypothetical protein [Galbitalea soli]|nr:hypothetical protein [Galbitalea soli]NYJ30806.1 hypothetical protein [Galbitalea soli]
MRQQTDYTTAASSVSLGVEIEAGNTVGVWLMALLPLVAFIAFYAPFGALALPVTRTAELLVALAMLLLGLVCAAVDRRGLSRQGQSALPSVVWAILPLVYLIVRCVRVGPRSLAPLAVWVVLQSACVGALFVLLRSLFPAVLR